MERKLPRRDFFGTVAAAAAGASMGAFLESKAGYDHRPEGEKMAEKAKFKREGELEAQAFQISALLDRANVLLDPLRQMLRAGIEHNSDEQRLFNLELGQLIETMKTLRYEDMNYSALLSNMEKPIDADEHLIPGKLVAEIGDITSEVQLFLENLTKNYPAYQQVLDLMEVMTNGDLTRG